MSITDMTWCEELADPSGGPVLCHNDVCLENVVFREGSAVALLDFDFAAPGRRVFDLAALARMCVPIDDPTSARLLGWSIDDNPLRLRVVADSYGLDRESGSALLEASDRSMAGAGEFVRRRVEAGEAAFIDMWERMGGGARYERRHRWWLANREAFQAELERP
jgi:aminoglycoside phosphotransferase (APT) family kinase protein